VIIHRTTDAIVALCTHVCVCVCVLYRTIRSVRLYFHNNQYVLARYLNNNYRVFALFGMKQQNVQEIDVDKTHSNRGGRELRSDNSDRVDTILYTGIYERLHYIIFFAAPSEVYSSSPFSNE